MLYLAVSNDLDDHTTVNEVDLIRVRGLHQVYGGLIGDGTVGKHMFATLRNEVAGHLSVTLARLPVSSGVYPLSLSVVLAGNDLGSREIVPPAADESPVITLEWPLPASTPGPLVDVLLRSSNWVVTKTAAGRQPCSFKLLRLALESS